MAKTLNLNIPELNRTKVTINKDENKVIELNLSDMNILNRLDETYSKLTDLANKAITSDGEFESPEDFENAELSDEQVENFAKVLLTDVDKEMRQLIDYLFDYPVSDIILPDGSMFDPVNGNFKFEIIIESLFGLYEDNLVKEAEKIRKNVLKHTDKYIK